jgi:hypothetical protein
MRALVTVLWVLLCGVAAPIDASDDDDARRAQRVSEYERVLVDAQSAIASPTALPLDLPEGVREAVEAWTRADT